jgi:porin
MKKSIFTVLVFGFLLSFAAHAEQQDSGDQVADPQATDEEAADGGAEAAMPPGILPIPDYSSPVGVRDYLAGDFKGQRTARANDNGFQWNIDTVTWTDTAVDGGTTNDIELGGNLTYNLNWDLMRADILPGALLTLRAESRWGSSGILNTGQAVPMNTAALTPTNYTDFDEGYGLAVTQLSYLQMLSTKFGLLAGKLDLFGDGDMNEFATGRGRTQFMNWSLNYGTANLIVPASTIGVAMVILPNERLNIVTMLTSATECVSSNCFKDLDDKGGASITSVGYQYQVGGLPGGVTGNFIYLFDKDFEELDGILPIPPPPGFKPSPDKDHSWVAGGTFWQYISTREVHEGPLNLMNRKQDLAGWGIFGRLTFADPDTNPWKTSVALGLGARGMIDGRPDDEFGVGYFYNKLSNVENNKADPDDGQGVEGYYNVAVLPSLRLSLNLQWIKSVRPSVDNTFAVSTRLQLVF